MKITLSQTGVTAIPAVFINPPVGKKWTIVSAGVILHSSATAGSRQIQILVALYPIGTIGFLTSASTSTVSISVASQGGPFPNGNSPQTWTFTPKLGPLDNISFGGMLISGDTFDWTVEVDEEEA